MKAKLEFDLPEEWSKFNTCVHGLDWALIVMDILEDMRLHTNYDGNNPQFKTADDVVEHVREKIVQEVEDRGLVFPE